MAKAPGMGLWQGLGGAGEPPAVLDREFGTCLVVGDARGVFADIAAWEARYGAGATPIVATGFIGTVWPRRRLDYWVTLHTEEWIWRYWTQARLDLCGDHLVHTISRKRGPAGDLVKTVLPLPSQFLIGSSGLFAALAALMLGFDKVVLAGIPLDDGGRFYEPPSARSAYTGDSGVTGAWKAAIEGPFAGRVTSLSGRTREWLGAPPELEAYAGGLCPFDPSPSDPAWRG